MFHRNPKSQNTTSASKCAPPLVVVAWLFASGLSITNAQAQTSTQKPTQVQGGTEGSAAPSNVEPTPSTGASPAATNPSPPSASPANQSPPPAPGATDPALRVIAREFATRGAEAFERGAFAEALEDFNRAAALFDAPTIAIMQARTLVHLGRWLEGLDRYQRTARQTPSPADPTPFHDAVRQAAVEGEVLRKRLPQLTLVVDERLQHEILVELDGQPLPTLLLNTSRPIDPGAHQLKASKGGVAFLERTIESTPEQHLEVEISPPHRAANSVVTPPPRSLTPLPPTPPAAEDPPLNWPLIGVATIGGLGAAGGVTTAVLGSLAQQRLDDKCGGHTRCPPEQQRNIDTLNTSRALFYVSSAMFAIGGSLTAYLLLSEEEDGSSQAQLSLSPFGAQLTTLF